MRHPLEKGDIVSTIDGREGKVTDSWNDGRVRISFRDGDHLSSQDYIEWQVKWIRCGRCGHEIESSQ